MKENIMATNFEPQECVTFVQSTKIGTHENKAIHNIRLMFYTICLPFSKYERRGSDASLKSTSSEKLCGSLYENNANYSTDSVSSNASNTSLDPPRQPDQGGTQEVDGVYDILVYIGEY